MSYFNGIVQNSAKEITKVLGKSLGPSDDGKSLRNWWKETENGLMFSIYDYKEYRKIKYNETYNYHIGTLTKEDTKKAIKYLCDLGLNAKFDE